jgi:hypothetical protein
MVDPDRPQVTTWCMRTSCYVSKAINIYAGCVILTALKLQQWRHELASLLRQPYIACLVYYGSLLLLSTHTHKEHIRNIFMFC